MIKLNEYSIPQLDTIHNCRAEALLSAMDTASVDLVVTSPPYDDMRKYNGFTWNFEYIAQQTYRVLKPGGVLVWVVGDATVNGSETLTSFEQALYLKRQIGFLVETMIWNKPQNPGLYQSRYEQSFEYMFVCSKGAIKTFNPLHEKTLTPGSTTKKQTRTKNGVTVRDEKTVTKETKIMQNVWRIPVGFMHTTQDDIFGEHPAMFPETLAERHILTWSNPGDVVLDYFGGSGTTAKMARKNGRRWLTCDISDEYCDLMKRRLSQAYTPMFAELLGA